MHPLCSNIISFALTRGIPLLLTIPSKISQAVQVPFQLLTALYRRVKSSFFPDRRTTPFPLLPTPSPNPPSSPGSLPPLPLLPTPSPNPSSSQGSLPPFPLLSKPSPNPLPPQADCPPVISPVLCPHCSAHAPVKTPTFAETFPPFRVALDTVKRKESDCVANWRKSARRIQRSTIPPLVTQFQQLEEKRHLLHCVHLRYTAAFSQLSLATQAELNLKPSDADPFLTPSRRLQQLYTCLTSLVEQSLNTTNLQTMDSLTEEDKRLFSDFIPLFKKIE